MFIINQKWVPGLAPDPFRVFLDELQDLLAQLLLEPI
jgi:hypothetical protein